MTSDIIATFFAVFIPLLIIVNPSSTLALFSVITAKSSKKERIKTAKFACLYASILLIIFAIGGSSILSYLSIEVYALRIAGGLLLGFVGLDMLRRGEQFGEGPPDKKQSSSDMALVPLALPSLSGPGAITVTIVSMNNPVFNWWIMIIIVIVAIVLTMLITYVIFMGSILIVRILGKKGMDAFTRVMGLLTVAIAVQFALTGFSEWISTLSI